MDLPHVTFDSHTLAHCDAGSGGRPPHQVTTDKDAKVIDLGCGIGFWLIEFWQRGYRNLTGADLSDASLNIARRRCELYGVKAELYQANAEALDFADASFDHVNCQGVIHHTPDTKAALDEIARVLIPGGTASVSVYYQNFVLRNWLFFVRLPASQG